MYEKKLSIIIPTRNRQKYAYECVKTILGFHLDGCEIVVHDNSDDDSLREKLSALQDNDQLKYRYDGSCLSFCDNFEKAVEMSSGDYLLTIGDDDCIIPEIIELVNIMREKDVDAVLMPTSSSYFWPDVVGKNAGKLVIRKDKRYIKRLYTKDALKNMKKSGNYDYQKYNFPKVYHAVVSREKFDLVKEKTGHYFGGLTPDIYSAVALSFYIDKLLYVSTSFTLPGISPKSGSADSLTGKHTGELKDAPHFKGHTNYEWDAEIPYVYSVETIWAESCFKAVKENGGEISLTDKEYFAFLSTIVKDCPLFEDRMIDLYANRVGQKPEKVKKAFRKEVKKKRIKAYIRKRVNFVKQLLIGRYTYHNIEHIHTAIGLVQTKLKDPQKILKRLKKMKW